MRLATRVTVENHPLDDDHNTKRFTSEEFRRIQRSFFFCICLPRRLLTT